MPSKTIFPFELPAAPEPYFVSVPPQIAAVMNSGGTDEQKAIHAIAGHYEQKGDVWGFPIPKRFGFTLSEKTKLQESEGLSREAMKRGLRLVQKIAKETDQSVGEIQSHLVRADQEGVDVPDWMLPYMEEFIDLDVDKADPRYLQYCILIQRTIPKFTLTNTEALHPRVLEQIAEILEKENSPVIEPQESKSEEDEESGNSQGSQNS